MQNRVPDEQQECVFFTSQTACNEDTLISLEEPKDLPIDERHQHQGQHAGFGEQVSVTMQMNWWTLTSVPGRFFP